MKNIFNKFAFFIALSFVFISCGNLTTSENDDSIPQGKGKITISTDLQNGRSVLPTAITKDTTGLTWELVGTSEGKTYSNIWDDDTDETGTVTVAYKSMTSNSGIVIDTGTWDFTLTASNTDGKNVLSATISTTINAGENKLNFVMQEATENAASGRIEFTLNFPGDVVTKGIATLTPLAGGNSFTQGFTADAATSNQFLSSITYTNENISAGYYILKIELQQKGDATTPTVEPKTINTYSCLIRVAPGLTSQGEDTLDKLAQLYTVTYNLNEGTFDSTTSPVPTSYNAYTSFALPTPTKAGYEFAGWYTDENLQKPVQLDESNKYKITQDTTLYAKWKISWDGLKQQIENNSGISEFVITEDLTATSTITVSKPFKITSDKNVTITRGNSIDGAIFEDAFFNVVSAGNLELEGTENITITLDGGNANESPILATAPLITSSGNLTLTNCILQNNTNTGYGGGVYISDKSSIFTMKGGEISGNSAEYGGGVAVDGSFFMSGGAVISSKNDVYLAKEASIKVTGNLTGTTPVATITPNEYSTTWQVITVPESADGATSSVTLSEQVGKFAVTPQTSTDGATINWTINANGFLSKEVVYYVGNNENDNPQGTETSPFTTLQAAVDEVTDINDGTSSYTIYVMSNITWEEDSYVAVPSNFISIDPTNSLNLKICGYNSTGVTIDANQKGRVMYISPNANVTLQNLILTGGYLNGNDGAGLYILNNTAAVTIKNCEIKENTIDNGRGAGIFVVYNSGNLKLTIENSKIFSNTINHNDGIGTYSGAGIAIENVEANITIKDSEITGNRINQAGVQNTSPIDRGVGLWLGNSAETTISGSTISNNIIENAALNNENAGGGVYLTEGSLTIQNSTEKNTVISGNSSTIGGGVYVSGGTFTMSGGAYVDSNNDVYLANGTSVTVAADLSKEFVATITLPSYNVGTPVITVADDNVILADKVGKFTLKNENYKISDDGSVAQNSGSSGTVTGTPVSDFSTLKTNIADAPTDGSVTELYLTNDINMTEYLNINSGQNIVLKTNGNYSIYRGSGFTGSFFTVNSGATFKLGNDDGIYKITLDGRTSSSETEGLSASYPFIKQVGTLTVSNCIMQYNKNSSSSVIGGAIYSEGTTTITNTSFMNNANTLESTTNGCGGAIYLLNNGNATISNCTFENNTTYQRGGAIYIGGSTSNTVITVSGSTFKNNIATNSTGNGGAICVSSMYGTVSLTSLTCSNNCVDNATPTSEDIAYRGSISSVTKNIGNISCENIYIDKENTLNVIENISSIIKLTIDEYVTGSQIINFNNFANKANFTLSDTNYTISDDGTVVQNSGGSIAYNVGEAYEDDSGTVLGYIFDVGDGYIKIANPTPLTGDDEVGLQWCKSSLNSSLTSITDGLEMKNKITSIGITNYPLYAALPSGDWYVPTKSEFELMLQNLTNNQINFEYSTFWTSTINSKQIYYYCGSFELQSCDAYSDCLYVMKINF